MSKSLIKDPFLYGEWFGLSWFHSCYITGHVVTIKKELGYGPSIIVAEEQQNVQRQYLSRSEWTNTGKRCLQEIILGSTKLENVLKKTRIASNRLHAVALKLEQNDLYRKSKKAQMTWLNKFHNASHRVWSLGMVPNVLELENSFLTDYLKQWLSKTKLGKEKAALAFQDLTMPLDE